jgi:subtilisin family serine protease
LSSLNTRGFKKARLIAPGVSPRAERKFSERFLLIISIKNFTSLSEIIGHSLLTIKEVEMSRSNAFRASRFVIFVVMVFLAAALPLGAQTAAKNIAFGKVAIPSSKTNPKIQEALSSSLDFMKKASPAVRKDFFDTKARNKFLFRLSEDGSKIQLYIVLNSFDQKSLDALKKFGSLEIETTDGKRKIVQAQVPIADIDRIAAMPEVKFIRLPDYGFQNTGSLTTEGDVYLHTDAVRSDFNYTGRGVKVGVISDGILDADRSVLNRDLPPYAGDPCTTAPANYIGDVKFRSFSSYGALDGSEGTAILEIIHDIAPNAKLFFSNFDSDLHFTQAKNWLASEGCDVIIDDYSFFNSGPYDGTSDVSLASTHLVQQGICYYTSAGNYAQNHYGGYFTDNPSNQNKIHNFVLTSTAEDETLEVTIPGGSTPGYILVGYCVVFLDWYEPFGESGDDIDLWMLDPSTMSFDYPIAASRDIQDGDDDPVEALYVYNDTGSDYVVSIVITRKHYDLTPRRMDMYILSSYMNEYIVPESSLPNNSDAGGGVISVGAIDVSDPKHDKVESFSSRGPTIDGRLKPEISSFDGVQTGVEGFNPFFGTSASAPHAAAVAALLRQFIPGGLPDIINFYMRQYAVDLYTPGADNISGSGRLDAYPIFDALINTGYVNRSKTYNFSASAEGWASGSAAPLLTAPTFSIEPGRLVITSVNNTNTYGFWQSPIVAFLPSGSTMLMPDRLYHARVRISSDAGVTDFPTFRIRIGAVNNASIAALTFNSSAGNDVAPPASGKDYDIYFIPPISAIPDGIYIALDMLNFDPSDRSDASLYLDSVFVEELDIP